MSQFCITTIQFPSRSVYNAMTSVETNNTMNQDEFVIFAELDRDRFDEILQTLKQHFGTLEHGRQGDDWIWVHFGIEKIEIDSFYSMNLELKGRRGQSDLVGQILQELKDDWILQFFDPPKTDMTR